MKHTERKLIDAVALALLIQLLRVVSFQLFWCMRLPEEVELPPVKREMKDTDSHLEDTEGYEIVHHALLNSPNAFCSLKTSLEGKQVVTLIFAEPLAAASRE